MTEKWLGVTVSGAKVTIVEAEVPDTGPLIIVNDTSISLQKGDTAEAYSVLHNELSDYARENGINNAIVKGSAVSQQGKPTLAHLHSAELRGVAIAALASVCATKSVTKATMSKNIGDRKVDDYVKDDDFWGSNFSGSVRSGSKEAAFCILTECRK